MSTHASQSAGTLIDAGVIVSCLVALAGIVAAAAVAQHQIDDHDTRIDRQDERLEVLKKEQADDRNVLIEVRNDVRWIRAAVAKQ